MRLVTLPLLVSLLLPSSSAWADDEDHVVVEKPRAEAAGFHLDLTVGSSARSGEGGPSGGFRFGYGWKAGPLVVGPQLLLDLAVGESTGVLGVVPGLRLELPIEHFGPYLEGGIGAGVAASNANGMQPIFELGGGSLYHFGSHFAAGIEVLYITGYDNSRVRFFDGWRYGPLVAALF